MALVDTDNLLKRFSRYLRLERGLSENTIAGYMSDVEKLVDFIDSENLDWRTVTGADLHQFVATLQDLGIGARSQARIISGVKSFFNFLRMEKCIDTNPSELIETPKLGMKLPDVLTVEEVDELVELMVEVMVMTDDSVIRIAGVDKPAAIVKNRYLKLRYQHIQYVLLCLRRNTTKIKNIRAYLLTTLYNSFMTVNHYYQAEVNHDLSDID